MGTLTKELNLDNISANDALLVYKMAKQRELLGGYTIPTKPSPDGRWYLHVKDSSKKSGRKTLAAKTQEELIDKLILFLEGVPTSSTSFEKMFNLAFDEKLSLIKNETKLLSAKNSTAAYKRIFNRFIAGTDFAKQPIETISKQDIENLILNILKENDIRKKALTNLKSLLNQTFIYALDKEIVDTNPIAIINFKKFTYSLADEVSIKDRYFSNDEIDSMLSYCREREVIEPSNVRIWALELQLLCGLRRGEVPPLRWIDVTPSSILIRREMIRQKEDGKREVFYIVNHTKTNDGREFPLTTETYDYLNRLKAMLDEFYPNSEYLFPSDTSTGTIKLNEVYRAHVTMCRRLGIEIDSKTIKGPHAFRRTRITEVANNSGDLLMTSLIFGNSPQVIQTNYFTGINISRAQQVLEACGQNRQIVATHF